MMYDEIRQVTGSIKGLALDAIGDCFGGDKFKYARYAADNNMDLFNTMVSDCVDHYYDMAADPDTAAECGEVERYELDMFIRLYIYEHINDSMLLSRIPPEPPAAVNKEAKPEKEEDEIANANIPEDGEKYDKNENIPGKKASCETNCNECNSKNPLTDEEREFWNDHECCECEKHKTFEERRDCIKAKIEASKKTKELKDKIYGDFEELAKHDPMMKILMEMFRI